MTTQPVILLRLPELSARIGLRKAAIYARMNGASPQFDPSFPKPVKLSARAVAWVESEIDAWVQSKIAATRQSAA